ncbi:MAG TPA: sensor histidine kinase KdpD [Stellaceae bacterium]|nr:sensor histidine kinase KdpD [Stellaceae bacterium]
MVLANAGRSQGPPGIFRLEEGTAFGMADAADEERENRQPETRQAESRQADGRPSPEALLIEAAKEKRGHFKLFLGAAPGVGKTFEMLSVGRARKAEGIDVVIGVVETHGRGETAALVPGMEAIPLKRIAYKGHVLTEMDLDAILKRRPRLVLVDELAHTNAEGSRHPKRYLDVQELLAAGIDVMSTLNIQHLESLNDIVAKITRIRVRETVPDAILDLADEIEVIDLTPEALMQRLREGKVYVRDQAQRALKHYFSAGNLTALRELALRATAQRVDEQMLRYMHRHAIEGPWPASDRVLVCVSDDPRSAELVRYAQRMADRWKAKWLALHVERQSPTVAGSFSYEMVVETLRMAERLGAEAVTISGQNVAEEVLNFARVNNVSHIVVGSSRHPRWQQWLRGSVVHALVRKAGSISVHLIAGEAESTLPLPMEVAARRAKPRRNLTGYVGSTVLVALATGLSVMADQAMLLPNLSLVFITAVLLSALRWGLGASVWAAVLSAAAYNFFFLPPFYSFTISDPANFVSLLFFLIVALIVSNLAAQAQRHAAGMAERNRVTSALYAFSRKLAAMGGLDELLWAITYQIASMLKCEVVILLPEHGTLALRGAYPPEDQLDAADMAAASWSWTSNRAAGRGADTLPGGKRLFRPLQTGRGAVGVVGIYREQPALLSPDERRLLDALMDQAAVAIERVRLAEDVDRVKLQAETERLRNALLTSVSHDLRTPLATIIGALTSLKSFGRGYDPATCEELVQAGLDEAERLNRFVGNLLDMTRLEFGGPKVKRQALDLADIVTSAVGRAGRLLDGHRVVHSLPADLPLIEADPVLLEQVLFNLLDNAAKYTPIGTMISIAAYVVDDRMVIDVTDEGAGIPMEALETVFDKFTRLQAGDRRAAGTGLGLPICRGFVEAMGGSIVAANREDRPGAIFTIRLPLARAPFPMPTLPAAVA